MDEVDWKAAYQFEHEEHKKTLLILDKAMEESNRVFVKTRDLIRFLEEISEQPRVTNKPKKSARSSYKWK
jgi:hypothetical protein